MLDFLTFTVSLLFLWLFNKGYMQVVFSFSFVSNCGKMHNVNDNVNRKVFANPVIYFSVNDY